MNKKEEYFSFSLTLLNLVKEGSHFPVQEGRRKKPRFSRMNREGAKL